MTEEEIKLKIKEILAEPILKGITNPSGEYTCKFCGWKPKHTYGHKPAALLTHLAYNHKGQYKTKVDKLYDFIQTLRKENCLCGVTLE